jgi:hypothetical protein
MLSLIIGVLVGVIIILMMEFIGQLAFPIPPNFDVSSTENLSEYIKEAPLGALLFVIFGWATGSFGGGFMAALIAKEDLLRRSILTGIVLMAMGLANLLSIPHPFWFWILGLSVFLPFAYWGGKIVEKYRNNTV